MKNTNKKHSLNSNTCFAIRIRRILSLRALTSWIASKFIKNHLNIVHIDPVNNDHPKYEAIAQTIKDIISQDKRVNSFHELRIVGCDVNKCNVIFDIALEEHADEQETYDIIRSIQEKFKDKFHEMKTVIKADPKYAYNL